MGHMLPRATHEHSFAFSEKEKLVLEVSHIYKTIL